MTKKFVVAVDLDFGHRFITVMRLQNSPAVTARIEMPAWGTRSVSITMCYVI